MSKHSLDIVMNIMNGKHKNTCNYINIMNNWSDWNDINEHWLGTHITKMMNIMNETFKLNECFCKKE